MDKPESGGSAYEVEAEYERPVKPSNVAPGEVVLGTMTGIGSDGSPQVDYVDNPSGRSVAAISTVSATREHINRQVALLFSDGDYSKPVIVGFVHSPLYAMLDKTLEQGPEAASETDDDEHVSGQDVAHVDGDRVVIEGKNEVVLKCGESSITLTRAGKILIRGKYLLNRSSGVNRILGGSVQVN